MSDIFPEDDERHGTYAGAQRHQYYAEPKCAECLQAQRLYMADLRARNETKRVEDRKNARAHNRAKQRLADAHRREYERLLVEEKRKEWAS